MKKQDIRKHAKSIRDKIDLNLKLNKDQKIVDKISKHEKYLSAKIIGIYYPFNSEINIRLLNKPKTAYFAYPKMIDGKIAFILTDLNTKWEINKFGINEPIEGKIVSEAIDLLIVPALAINQNKYRIGYGKGYYDEFIKTFNPKYTIGIIYNELRFTFKEDPWDQQLNEIVSN